MINYEVGVAARSVKGPVARGYCHGNVVAWGTREGTSIADLLWMIYGGWSEEWRSGDDGKVPLMIFWAPVARGVVCQWEEEREGHLIMEKG